ncbi:MAG: hypothetical protein FWE13_02380 [Firmicutes bacterium]|nr:hypothetical protein [Bacillota bacterium]
MALNFERNARLIGDGRISGAVERNGEIHFFLDTDGAIMRRTMPVGARATTQEQFVSFANEYTEVANASVSLFGQEIILQ